MRDDISGQERNTIEKAAQQIVEQVIRGDVNSIRASIVPSQQSSADAIIAGVTDNQAAVAGGRPQLRSTFLLDTGANPSPDGRFYCGVIGATGMSANGAEFYLPGLTAGRYAIVIEDLAGSRPYALTTILEDLNGWKLAGLYIRPETAAGHDGLWYLQQARDFKGKGQNHNAWFYYFEAWELLAPVRFIETSSLANIVKEANGVLPSDVPAGGKTVSYAVNGKTYKMTDMTVYSSDKSFDLSIKYSVPSTADFAATTADARTVANAYVAQYPELKEAFDNLWAHAIDPNGGDVPAVIRLKK